MKDESQETLNLGFAGHELQKDPREPDGFFGQIAPALVGARHVVPADPEGGVNRFQHGVKALRQFTLLRDFERNTTAADFVFARNRRCPIVFGAIRKDWAMRAASRPNAVCSIRGVCIAGSIAGCAQTKSSLSRSSGNSVDKAASVDFP